MGADLIGYMGVGPAKLDKKLRDTAVRCAENIVGQARYVLDIFEPAEGEAFNWAEMLVEFPELEQRVQATAGYTDEYENTIDRIADLNPEEIVESLFLVWDGNARDATSRLDPDDKNKMIIFAGDRSWGDEPDGFGYRTLMDAEALGLADLFGIR